MGSTYEKQNRARGSDEPRRGIGRGQVPLEAILRTEELSRRPASPPDHARENRAMTELVRVLAESPNTVLQKVAETILELLDAGSAGLNLLTTRDGPPQFRWLAVAGAWKPLVGTLPAEFGPSADALDSDAPLLFTHFEQRYPSLKDVAPIAEEALFVPFYVGEQAVGTVWALAHDQVREFDTDDVRKLESLGRFASVAHRVVELQTAGDSRRAALNLMEDAVLARRASERLNLQLRASEVRLSSELENARRLYNLSTHVIAQGDLTQLYDEILDAAMGIMDADMASMQEVDDGANTLVLVASKGFGPDFRETFSLVRPEMRTSCSVARQVSRRVVIPDVEACDFIVGTPALEDHRRTGIRAIQSTPLMSRAGSILGMISTHWRRPTNPPEHAFRMLDVLARQVADLLEHRRAQETLRESEERFRALADNIPQLAWIADAGGRPFWRNRRWHDYTGASRDEARGSARLEFIHPEHVDRVMAGVERSRAMGEVWEDTFPLRGKDDHYRWFLSRSVPIRDADGNVRRWFGTHTDVTEQRAMADHLVESVGKLGTANRLMSDFVASMAHELRGPLAPIVNALHLMEMGVGEEVRHSTRKMLGRQVDHMVHLVDDLLDVSRISRGKIELRLQRVDLASTVQIACEEAQPSCEARKIEVSVTLPSEPVFCDGDPTRLAQILSNLLGNACKFTNEGGRIDLFVAREDGHAVIRVRDTGIGIEAVSLPRIFDSFMQIDRSFHRAQGGLGIGLTLVKNLVELHHGTVEARSEGLGRGSEFEVRLPLATELADALMVRPPEVAERRVSGRRILVVDDNRDSAESMAMVLEHSGHHTRMVHDGVNALRAAATFRPEVVLLDIGLPGMDGHAVARKIRAEPWGADMMLVALTGWGQEEDRRKSREAGFDAHVVKPARHADLMRVLARHPPPARPAT
jgi:PAS domain S-box-containing protein